MIDASKMNIGSYGVTRRLPGPTEAYQGQSSDGERVLLRLFAEAPGADLERVRREVAVCTTLEHPAIAKAFDIFEHEGRLVLVYKYFKGTELAQLLKRSPSRKRLGDAAIWHLGHQIAGALAQAHSATDPSGDMAAVCHGHLSPSNVVIAAETGELRIDGFGLGGVVGTAGLPVDEAYQAPEQAQGRRLTPRGDLFSAGALLWALLAGRSPAAAPDKTLDLAPFADRMPEPLREALCRALEPSVARRKITSMELEQWLSEVADAAEGAKALGSAVRSVVQSGRTLVGTGAAGMFDALGSPAAREAAVATPGPPAPAGDEAGAPGPGAADDAAMPFAKAPAGPEPAGRAAKIEKARTLGRVGGRPGVRTRQKTLLGAFPHGGGPEKPSAPAAPAEPASLPEATAAAAPAPTPSHAQKAAKAAALGRSGAKGRSGLRSRQRTLLGAFPPGGATAQDPSGAGPRQAGARTQPQQPGAAAPPIAAQAAEPSPRPGLPQTPAPADPEAAPASAPPSDDEEEALAAALAGATVGVRPDAEAPGGPDAEAPGGPDAADEPETVEMVVDADAEPPVRPPSGPPTPEEEAVPGAAAAQVEPFGEPVAPRAERRDAASGLSAVAAASPPPGAYETPPAATSLGAEALADDQASPSGSPWTAAEPAPRKPASKVPRPLPLWQAALVALVTALVVSAIGLWLTRRHATLSDLPSEPTGSVVSATSASPTAAATLSSTAGVEPSAESTAAATASASADATADATEPETAPAVERDGADLPPTQGLLLVRCDAPPDAQVFLFGKAYGAVNQKLEVPCGRAFVRVGKLPGPSWLSNGASVGIACQALTEVSLEPL